jgi:hypothetical protein
VPVTDLVDAKIAVRLEGNSKINRDVVSINTKVDKLSSYLANFATWHMALEACVQFIHAMAEKSRCRDKNWSNFVDTKIPVRIKEQKRKSRFLW